MDADTFNELHSALTDGIVAAFSDDVVSTGPAPWGEREIRPEELYSKAVGIADDLVEPEGWTWSRTEAATEAPIREFLEAEHTLTFDSEDQVDAVVKTLVERGWTIA